MTGLCLCYYYGLDHGRVEEAGRYLDEIAVSMDDLAPIARTDFLLELAYFEGRYRQNGTAARRWLDVAKSGLMIFPSTRLRAEAAVLLGEGRREEAYVKAREGLEKLDSVLVPSFRPVEGDWLRDIAEVAAHQEESAV